MVRERPRDQRSHRRMIYLCHVVSYYFMHHALYSYLETRLEVLAKNGHLSLLLWCEQWLHQAKDLSEDKRRTYDRGAGRRLRKVGFRQARDRFDQPDVLNRAESEPAAVDHQPAAD